MAKHSFGFFGTLRDPVRRFLVAFDPASARLPETIDCIGIRRFVLRVVRVWLGGVGSAVLIVASIALWCRSFVFVAFVVLGL